MIQDWARLSAIQDIMALKARYLRAADTKDAALMRSVYHDDVVVDFRGAAIDPVTGVNCLPGATDAVLRGADHVVAAAMASIATFHSVHRAQNPEIEILDDLHACGIWSMMDILIFDSGKPVQRLHGYGRYYETYEKVDGRWTIKTLRFERCLLDVVR